MMVTMGLSSPSKKEIYDPFRKKWVVATPEEKVRQNLLQRMTLELSYPRELISVEKALSEMPHITASHRSSCPDRRVDLVCFAKGIHPDHSLYPLILIECKESSSLIEVAQQQVIGYNYFIKACFVAVAYPNGCQWGYYDSRKQTYAFSDQMPSYNELMQAVVHARK
jgi:hypothetical protein